MAMFTFENPKVEFILGSDMVKLLEPIVTPEVTVPAGFYSDGASVPSAVDGIVHRYDRYLPAYIVHDFCYSVNSPVRRDVADSILHVNLLRLGMDETKAEMITLAVKRFGDSHFQGSKK